VIRDGEWGLDRSMHRRSLLAAILSAAAAPGLALAEPKRMPLGKAFQFLEAYLKLPFKDRSLFYLAYRAVRGRRTAPDARADIVGPDGSTIPLKVSRDGVVTNPPSLDELQKGSVLNVEGQPFGMAIELRAAVQPAPRVDAKELAQSLKQLNDTAAKHAGPLAFMVPKFSIAYFPDAADARVVLADGTTQPLPTFETPDFGEVPYFEPGKSDAKAVVFARPPSRVILAMHPKKT
jgi:hypothetical protein